jgi:hypothetical protein
MKIGTIEIEHFEKDIGNNKRCAEDAYCPPKSGTMNRPESRLHNRNATQLETDVMLLLQNLPSSSIFPSVLCVKPNTSHRPSILLTLGDIQLTFNATRGRYDVAGAVQSGILENVPIVRSLEPVKRCRAFSKDSLCRGPCGEVPKQVFSALTGSGKT